MRAAGPEEGEPRAGEAQQVGEAQQAEAASLGEVAVLPGAVEADLEAGSAAPRPAERAPNPAEDLAAIEEGSEIPPIPTGSQEEWEITRARELFLP